MQNALIPQLKNRVATFKARNLQIISYIRKLANLDKGL